MLQLDDTLSNDEVYEQRHRVCDLGYLRHAYKRDDGTLGWRCGAEAVDAFERKGGTVEGTEGKKCVCNGLVANVGLPQRRRDGTDELPLITSGDDAREVARFLPDEQATEYSAADVVKVLLAGLPSPSVSQPRTVSP